MLLERESELEVLHDLFARLDTNGGKVVLIRGEAGIGKSALVRGFIETHGDNAHIYLGLCDDLLTPQPLGPIWDLGRDEPTVVVPLEGGDRRAVMEALLSLLSRTLRPTVFVLEDTQWADEATLDVITYVGRRIAETNGLLLLTYRDGEVDYDHPLRKVIGALTPQILVRVHLGGLSAGAVAAMLNETNLDTEEVLALTAGNALFVTEVAASGVQRVPSSVQDSVLARAAKLTSGARQVLDLVSVIPAEAERSLVENILEPTEEEMTECVRQGLLRVEDEIVFFHHELARRAVESILSPPDSRRLNAEVLAMLREQGSLARLVHHAREANDVDAIIEFAPQAARAAIAVGSHREASEHFRTLEPFLDRFADADRVLIIDDWARNELYLDNIESSLDLSAAAIKLHRSGGDQKALARALTAAVRLNEISGRPESATAASREAIAILEKYPPSADLAFAVSQRGWLSMIRSEWLETIELADRAIELAEQTGAEQTLIHALNSKGTAMYSRGDAGGLRLLEEARDRAEQGGYLLEETVAMINMGGCAAARRELDLASDVVQRTIDLAVRYEIRSVELTAQVFLADILLWKGEWAAAEDLATEVLESHSRSDTLAGRMLECLTGTLQARQGRHEAGTTLSSAWSEAEAAGEMQNLLPAAAALAEYMWLTGEIDSHRLVRFREVLDKGTLIEWPWPVGELAFWLWELGELPEIPEGIAIPYRLVMEGKPVEAAAIWDAKHIPYQQALALAHGDETARLEALEIFETLGATAVASKLRNALRDDRVAIPRGRTRDTRRHAAGLTVRQAEVLKLLDEGLSNLGIADRLFVSPRTVENHVSAVMMKLDSSTREEAVTRAHDEGILVTRP